MTENPYKTIVRASLNFYDATHGESVDAIVDALHGVMTTEHRNILVLVGRVLFEAANEKSSDTARLRRVRARATRAKFSQEAT